MRSLEQHAPREISKVLVGNKCDLDSEREVSEDMGRDLADEYGTAFFVAAMTCTAFMPSTSNAPITYINFIMSPPPF